MRISYYRCCARFGFRKAAAINTDGVPLFERDDKRLHVTERTTVFYRRFTQFSRAKAIEILCFIRSNKGCLLCHFNLSCS